jgi:hypothetical protein
MRLRKVISKHIRGLGDANVVVSANVGERSSSTSASASQHVVRRSRRTASAGHDRDRRRTEMSEEKDPAELTEEELERQRAEELPDREVMSTIRPWPPLPTVEPGGLDPLPPTEGLRETEGQ